MRVRLVRSAISAFQGAPAPAAVLTSHLLIADGKSTGAGVLQRKGHKLDGLAQE